VLERPSKGVINLPISFDENGHIDFDFFKKLPQKGPSLIADCKIENYRAKVFKQDRIKSALITQVKNGQSKEKKVPFVYSKTLTKDMLGQYSAAVDIAQALGITQVEYIKLYLVDPNIQLEKNRTFVFFYDEDNEIIDKTILVGKQWFRCEQE
jgi:hypothetical protein